MLGCTSPAAHSNEALEHCKLCSSATTAPAACAPCGWQHLPGMVENMRTVVVPTAEPLCQAVNKEALNDSARRRER